MHRIPTRSLDTTCEAERVQVDLLRAASVAYRLHLTCALSASAISAARRALARADPGADATERDIRFVELHYGPELAAALRAHLARRRSPGAAIPQ